MLLRVARGIHRLIRRVNYYTVSVALIVIVLWILILAVCILLKLLISRLLGY